VTRSPAPRIGLVTEAPPELQEILDRGPVSGGVLRVFQTLAHNPKLLKRFNVLAGGLLARGLLPPRERELVILRMAFRCRSVYEFGQHTMLGLSSGLTAEEVDRVVRPLAVAAFPPEDEALLRMVDELYDANRVTDSTWRQLAARWNEAELLELLMVAGLYWMVAGVLKSAQVELEPGAPGWPAGVSIAEE